MDENTLGLRKLHHIEFFVGNAKRAAYYYRYGFGFSQLAYAGLETGQRDRTSYTLQQGKARFVLTSPLHADCPMSEHIKKHGDGVRNIAFEVQDADQAFELAVARGAQAAIQPETLTDKHGSIRHAAIQTYGDTIHSFISSHGYVGHFLPGFEAMPITGREAGNLSVDHLVGNVEIGKMNYWADWYSRVCGFRRYMSFDDKDISTEYSALMSIVMANDSTAIKMPINL